MKSVYIIGGAVAAVLLVLIVWLVREPSGEAGEAAAGGREGSSIFDSNFWLSGVAESEDLELKAEFARLMDETNPRTGEPYTESEAKKVQYLAGRFPDNDLIPRPDIADREEALKEQTAVQADLNQRITAGEADEAGIEQYYDRLSKLYADQIELLEYASGDRNIEAEMQNRVLKMLDASREVRQQLADQKQQALEVYRRNQAAVPQ